MILRVRWPNQQCHSTEGWLLVNQVNGQSHQTQLFSVSHGARFAVTQDHPWGQRMGSLKSLCRTCYRSSIETIAQNCLVFSDKNEQTNRWTSPWHKAAARTLCGGSLNSSETNAIPARLCRVSCRRGRCHRRRETWEYREWFRSETIPVPHDSTHQTPVKSQSTNIRQSTFIRGKHLTTHIHWTPVNQLSYLANTWPPTSTDHLSVNFHTRQTPDHPHSLITCQSTFTLGKHLTVHIHWSPVNQLSHSPI